MIENYLLITNIYTAFMKHSRCLVYRSLLCIKFYQVTAYLSTQILFQRFQVRALAVSLEIKPYLLKIIVCW